MITQALQGAFIMQLLALGCCHKQLEPTVKSIKALPVGVLALFPKVLLHGISVRANRRTAYFNRIGIS